MDNQIIRDNKLQKANIYNKYLPFHEYIEQQGFQLFDEIRENLSRTIQLDELHPGFAVWSRELKRFMSLYGFYFTKIDHIKLINFYLSVLSITELNYDYVEICLDMLHDLLGKTQLISRNDLIIDWRILYKWTKFNDINDSFRYCVYYCAFYLSATATQEILDELRPHLYPPGYKFSDTIKIFEYFLPTALPVELHSQGFKLWLPEFFGIWESIYSDTWELNLITLFCELAWHNIGYIDWEPWLSQIFTRILRGFSLPIGEMEICSQTYTYWMSSVGKWIVAMMGNGSACLQYLRDLFFAIKSFYHPSNTGEFQEDLVDFVFFLAQYFVERVKFERTDRPVWYFIPHQSYRLTEENITDFVNCVKDYAFISIFNKEHSLDAAIACQHLSMLRPELIVSLIVEKLFSSIDSMTEPHSFTSIMGCLTRLARQIVRQTPSYSKGQRYVLPLLMSVLSGIDLNDFNKTSLTLEFLHTVLLLITCVDCSSAVHTRNDLTEIEKEVCLSTAKFEDFISEFFDRIFRMIETLSTDMSNFISNINEVNKDDSTIELKLTSIISSIAQQCSTNIFQMVRQKIVDFLGRTCLSSNVRQLVGGLVRAIVNGNPVETLKYLLPKTCESIETLINKSERLEHDKGDIELSWHLNIFSELLHARGDTLLTYKQTIMSVFHRCVHFIHQDTYKIVASSTKHFLQSLSQIYPIDYRFTVENLDEPFVDFLPIRAWGQYVDFDQFQVEFHIPNTNEIDLTREFLDTFLYPELTLLNEKCLKISNCERLKSLTLIYKMITGCFHMIPRIDSDKIENLTPAVGSYNFKHQIQYPIYLMESENLRKRLLIDIGNLLDVLVENHSDDVSSIKTAIQIYSLLSRSCVVSKDHVNKWQNYAKTRKQLFEDQFCLQANNPRFIVVNQIALQIRKFELTHLQTLTEIDKQIALKLFDLSIHRYSNVRSTAQIELFSVLNRYRFSYHVIIHRIVEVLNTPGEADHDKIKGCLYILFGKDKFFLPAESSWRMMEKLWPSLAHMNYAKKISTQNLIGNIIKKIHKQLIKKKLIENTNEISICAAAALWRPLDQSEIEIRNQKREERNQANIQSYTNLMEMLNSLFKDSTMTWRQQNTVVSLLYLLFEKHMPIPSSCIRTFLDCLVHENPQLRWHAVKGVVVLCQLQKPTRILEKKTLEEILHNIDKSLPKITADDECCPGDRDDNLWVTIDGYKPPETQTEWEQTCFLSESFHGYYKWPKTIDYSMNKRERYTQDNMPEQVAIIYHRFSDKNFIKQITEFMISDEEDLDFGKVRFKMFKGLFRNFGLEFVDNFMEQVDVLIHEKTQEKVKGSHRVAAEIVAGIIRGSKNWTLEMIDQLWKKLTPFLNEVCNNLTIDTLQQWDLCFENCMIREDPRRVHRLIHFLCQLIHNQTMSTTFNEESSWSLIQNLYFFQWRIPSIWCNIHQYGQELLDHPNSKMRNKIAHVFARTLRFDVTLFNGQSTRNPKIDSFFDGIHERLRKAIEIYEVASLVNVSDQIVEIDPTVRKALNFIETVIQVHKLLFTKCSQPIKDAIIRTFPYLCEIESIAINGNLSKDNLGISRMYVGLAYLNTHFLQSLIEQLEHVCMSPKWHARRVAIEFMQNMIFCNLFNARPYAQRLRELLLKCLFDERVEVRRAASTTLSGFYQCGYFQVTQEDLNYFRMMSKTKYFTRIDEKKLTSTKDIVKRHGGVLGLCAIVLSSPYDIPTHVPDVLTLLCEHSQDPHVIQESIKQCLSKFRRTHHDSWHEHREKFTDDQFEILSNALIPHNYYV